MRIKFENTDHKKFLNGEYCYKGFACFCKVGWPLEYMCPACRLNGVLQFHQDYCGTGGCCTEHERYVAMEELKKRGLTHVWIR